MTRRYVARPRAAYVPQEHFAHEVWGDGTVHEPDDGFTGLLNARGEWLYRAPHKVGF